MTLPATSRLWKVALPFEMSLAYSEDSHRWGTHLGECCSVNFSCSPGHNSFMEQGSHKYGLHKCAWQVSQILPVLAVAATPCFLVLEIPSGTAIG